MLRRAHQKLATPNIEKVIAGNQPFMRQPAHANGINQACKRGILLTHGLTDSPYFMRHLADFFAAQGFLVMAILLPGHGTQAGDLLDVTWQEWAKAVEYGTDKLAEEVDEVYLGGLSTGATLSVYQSLRDTRVRGLFLYSPALKISRRAAFANFHKLYSRFYPAAKWLSIQPDHDCYKYESFTKNAAAQMYALTRQIRSHRSSLEIPVFAVASTDDATVDTAATVGFMLHARHPASQLVLYSGIERSISTATSAANITWVNSLFPEQRIVSSSHLAIVLPKEDAHYGDAGEYANCAHYYPGEMEKYAACRSHPNEVAQGEITPENLRTGIMRRLMYNPNYTQMENAMREFIQRLDEA